MPNRGIQAGAMALLFGLGLVAPSGSLAEESGEDVARALRVARSIEADLVRAVARARAASVAVVTHRASRDRPASTPSTQRPVGAIGSGVLVDWRGTWVVTSLHVVEGEDHVEAVTADGRHHPLRIRARNPRTDLALLAFETPPRGLRPVRLGGAALPATGEGTWVLATGNPFFLALDGHEAATLGIVSGTRPPDANAYIDAPTVQHDAEINPGSSGGPLWDLQGRLLGINGTIATRVARRGGGPAHTGASFSVPVAAVRRFLTAILGPADGTLVRAPAPREAPVPGSLGLTFDTSRDVRGRPAGALVLGVDRRAPTSGRQGLRPGDVVVRLTAGGRQYQIRSASDVRGALARRSAGDPVFVSYLRQGRTYGWSGRLGGP